MRTGGQSRSSDGRPSSSSSSTIGIRYDSDAHAPRSMSLQRFEQNGRKADSGVHSTGLPHCGQRTVRGIGMGWLCAEGDREIADYGTQYCAPAASAWSQAPEEVPARFMRGGPVELPLNRVERALEGCIDAWALECGGSRLAARMPVVRSCISGGGCRYFYASGKLMNRIQAMDALFSVGAGCASALP